MSSFEKLGEDFMTLITAQASEMGVSLNEDLAGASQFASERAAHLSLIVGEPGFEEALAAERDSVALRFTSVAMEQADSVDLKFQAFIGQVLMVGARALSVAVAG